MTISTTGVNATHLRLHVIVPALKHLAGDDMPALASQSAVELLLGTIAQESNCRHLDQITGSGDTRLGPAIGLYQVEPATHRDIYDNYLRFKPELRLRVAQLQAAVPSADHQLATNLAYATAIARLVYFRSPLKLAAPGDVEGHARVWKQVYNTPLGKGTVAEFVNNWRRLVAPTL